MINDNFDNATFFVCEENNSKKCVICTVIVHGISNTNQIKCNPPFEWANKTIRHFVWQYNLFVWR